jgi:SAM-dependent methyltransferase
MVARRVLLDLPLRKLEGGGASRPEWCGDRHRFDYQQKYNTFDFQAGEQVLDIGGGHDPFPDATILSDRYLERTRHRMEDLVRDSRPFIILDVEDLPLKDKSIGFIYCSHVLEHVDDPLKACSELMRVGRRGYIETPTYAQDGLFAWAKDMHKWHVVSISNKLVFFEYNDRQLEGVRSSVWHDLIMGPKYHPLQEMYYNNLDFFYVMFTWTEYFDCVVYRLSDSSESAIRSWK